MSKIIFFNSKQVYLNFCGLVWHYTNISLQTWPKESGVRTISDITQQKLPIYKLQDKKLRGLFKNFMFSISILFPSSLGLNDNLYSPENFKMSSETGSKVNTTTSIMLVMHVHKTKASRSRQGIPGASLNLESQWAAGNHTFGECARGVSVGGATSAPTHCTYRMNLEVSSWSFADGVTARTSWGTCDPIGLADTYGGC